MTVERLIERLSEFPPDAIVTVAAEEVGSGSNEVASVFLEDSIDQGSDTLDWKGRYIDQAMARRRGLKGPLVKTVWIG